MRNINKLASLLDRAGKYNLADKLDKIAQNNDFMYKNEIEKYKALIQNKKHIEAQEFLDDIVTRISDQKTRDAFIAQAYNIHSGSLKSLYKGFMNNEEIYKLIMNYKLNSAKDLSSLNKLWSVMMTDLKNKKILNSYSYEQLSSIYNNLAAKFGYSEIKSNVSGNYTNDIKMYRLMLADSLYDESNKFLEAVMNSDKYNESQKQQFELQAKSLMSQHSNENIITQGNLIGTRQTMNDDNLAYDLRKFGIDKANNIQDFDDAWKKLINSYKNTKYRNDNSGKKILDYSGLRSQLENVRQRIMLSKGFQYKPYFTNPSK